MPRVLIVGCGCRGRELARDLVADGHPVRGTTRRPESAATIAATGAEPYVGDPDRIVTLMEALAGVTSVVWLLGTAGAPDLHAGRLRMFCEKIVDTPVRGLVYEASASRPGGRAIVAAAAATWQIPVRIAEPGCAPTALRAALDSLETL